MNPCPGRWSRTAVRALVFAALFHSSTRAHAQTAQDIERAKQSFRAGAAAYAAGEYLTAIQAFDTAYALTPLPAIAFSLAQAERRQYFVAHEPQHLERAIALFREYLERVPQGGRRADALDALSQLEPLAALRKSGGEATPADGKDSVRRTRLMIMSETEDAELSLDGEPPVRSPLIREVTPGDHRVVVHAAGYYPNEQKVTALEGELVVVPVRLHERPTKIALTTRDSAEVYVNGAFASEGGVSLELPSGVHRIVVAEKGYRVATHTLELGPGQVRNLDVRLERTRQRKAALTLFVAGGAALGAGVVLSSLAIRAENRAETYLAERRAGSLTQGELDEYDDAVAERDRFRLATILTLSSAGGLFVTGLFLHELDRPDPNVLYRTISNGRKPSRDPSSNADPTGRGNSRTVTSVRVAPRFSTNAFGALLEGRF